VEIFKLNLNIFKANNRFSVLQAQTHVLNSLDSDQSVIV